MPHPLPVRVPLGLIMITKMYFISLLLCCSLAVLPSFQARKDKITVLAGKGIVLNGDSILIGKTSHRELARILKIRDNNELVLAIWDGFDAETGERISGDEFRKELSYKTVQFEYVSQDTVNFKLNWIRVGKSKELEVKVTDDLLLGDVNPKLQPSFSKESEHDYISISGLTYNLYSRGISLQLDTVDSQKVLKEVSVHYTIKE
jgi:hypothetical protein